MLTSAQLMKVSWGPHPEPCVPLAHVPHLLPPVQCHWNTHRLQVKPAGSLTCNFWSPMYWPSLYGSIQTVLPDSVTTNSWDLRQSQVTSLFSSVTGQMRNTKLPPCWAAKFTVTSTVWPALYFLTMTFLQYSPFGHSYFTGLAGTSSPQTPQFSFPLTHCLANPPQNTSISK